MKTCVNSLALLVAIVWPAWGAGERSVPGPHPVHVSSTQISLSRDQRHLDITMRIFTDDLEVALKGAGHPASLTGAASVSVDSALSRYLQTRFVMIVDGASTTVSVRGHQREDDATLVLAEVALPRPLQRVTISQQILFELHADQTNLLHLKSGATTRSAMLRRGAAPAVFAL